jgi:hypothetical protein
VVLLLCALLLCNSVACVAIETAVLGSVAVLSWKLVCHCYGNSLQLLLYLLGCLSATLGTAVLHMQPIDLNCV